MNRFVNQIALPNMGNLIQDKIKNTSALIIGAGGLGCPVALNLAALGIGKIGIVDFDNIEISNLNRQTLYGINDIGKPKTDTLIKHFKNKYNDIIWESFLKKMDSENANDIINSYDYIIETTDDLNTKFLVNDTCQKFKKKLVIGSIFQLEGQICTFDFERENLKSFRQIFTQDNKPIYNCADQGTLGSMTSIIGAMMCSELLKNIQNNDNFGKLIIYKWQDYSTQIFEILNPK